MPDGVLASRSEVKVPVIGQGSAAGRHQILHQKHPSSLYFGNELDVGQHVCQQQSATFS